MTDLKELIKREVAGFLDWPGDNKNIVTTASAMLFAEHVATLYADHFRGAGNIAAPAVQGEPVAWLEGEPSMRGATLSSLTALTRSTRLHLTKPGTSNPVWPLYTAQQPAERQPAPDVSALVEALELARRTLAMAALEGEVTRRIDSALAAHRKGGDL